MYYQRGELGIWNDHDKMHALEEERKLSHKVS
jgi:hypothetical protein